MKLNRRYFRNIRDNLSFYISATVLTVVTLLLFFLFSTTGNAILDFRKDFFERNKVEDAHFFTYSPIPAKDIEKLEAEYHVVLEAETFANVEANGKTSRIFQKTEKTDLYEVTVGKDVAADDEVVISEGYAVAQGIQTGDCISIGEKEYTVTGFFQRPDYLYMLEHPTDAYKNVATFHLGYMTEKAYSALPISDVQYLVRYEDGADSVAFRRAIHENYIMREYHAAAENPRISMVKTQADLFVLMSYLFLCTLPLIAVVLISIIISRKVKSEQKMIGTLSALGYRKGQLIRHYAGFAAIPGLLGGVFTVLISFFLAQPYSEAGLMDYEPMRVAGRINPLNAVLGILVPTALYVLAGVLSVRRLLKKDTVLLLNGNADGGKQKNGRRMEKKTFSWRGKFALRSLFGNPARGLVVILGAFLGCSIMLLGCGLYDSIVGVGKSAAEQIGTYQYQYVLNELRTDNPYGGGEPLLMAPLEDEKGNGVAVMGTAGDNPLLIMKDLSGSAVNPENGYYISSLAQYAFDWQVGEEVVLVNPLSMEKTAVTVAGVIFNNSQKLIYTSMEKAAAVSGLEENAFNALLSEESLSIPAEKVAAEHHMDDWDEQAESMLSQLGTMIWVILILGVIICVSAVYVAVNMVVTENRHNISMLKVLGYRERQINRIVLRPHHLLPLIGILAAIPFAFAMFRVFFRIWVTYGLMLVTVRVTPLSFAVAIGLTLGSYVLSLLLLGRKIKKVDMIESLKDNRE